MPLCKDREYTFAPNNPTVVNATKYDGNATAYDWTADAGMPLNTNNNGGGKSSAVEAKKLGDINICCRTCLNFN